MRPWHRRVLFLSAVAAVAAPTAERAEASDESECPMVVEIGGFDYELDRIMQANPEVGCYGPGEEGAEGYWAVLCADPEIKNGPWPDNDCGQAG